MRVLIRNMSPIDAFRNRLQRVSGPVTDRIRRRRWADTRQRNRDDIAAHYDLGNDFFELFLDETMTYSCAVFPTASTSLADASRHKYDLLIDKLGLTAEHHLLEIGTGWGGLAIRAVERTGCRVTTTTISAEQLREARSRIAAASVDDRVTLLDEDWRDLSGRPRSGDLDRDDRSRRLARLRRLLRHDRALPRPGRAGGDPGDLRSGRAMGARQEQA